nr:immunoglobulin light chain junction region [Macaca mulatta]
DYDCCSWDSSGSHDVF